MGLKLITGMVVVVLLACVAGCGGGGSSSSSTVSAQRDGGEGTRTKDVSAQFLRKGGANKYFVHFGREASSAEREAASAVLAKNLKARESRDFATQCATLNGATLKEIAIGKKGEPAKLCPKLLEELAKPFAKTAATRRDTLAPPIAALRVKGDEAYALYHGTDKADYAFKMEREGDEWKVGALLANALS